MHRREFLFKTGGAAATAVCASTTVMATPQSVDTPAPARPAVATGVRSLALSTPWDLNGRGAADSVYRLAQRVGTLSGGRLTMRVQGGQPVGEADKADIIHASAHDFAGHHAAFAYFAGLPGRRGVRAQDFSAWLAVGGGQMLWDELADDFAMKPLLVGHTGDAAALWTLTPITSVVDFAGKRIYAPGLSSAIVRGLGAEAVDLSPDAAARAFLVGEIDAMECGSTLAAVAAGLGAARPHVLVGGFASYGSSLALHVRRDVWASLSGADQAVLSAAAIEEFQASIGEIHACERVARKAMNAQFGVTFASMPAEITAAIDPIAEAAIAHVAGFDARAKRIDQSFRGYRAELEAGAFV